MEQEHEVRPATPEEIAGLITTVYAQPGGSTTLERMLCEKQVVLRWHNEDRDLSHRQWDIRFMRLAAVSELRHIVGRLAVGLLPGASDINVVVSLTGDSFMCGMSVADEIKDAWLISAYPYAGNKIEHWLGNSHIEAGQRVLIVSAESTRAGDVDKLIEVIRWSGGLVAGVLSFACLHEGGTAGFANSLLPLGIDPSIVYSLIDLRIPSWPASECPLCAQGDTLLSRQGPSDGPFPQEVDGERCRKPWWRLW